MIPSEGVISRTKQPAKTVFQVITALRSSKNADGPTMRDIFKYINISHEKPATKRQIQTVLKQAIDFGIVKKLKGHYKLSSPDEPITFVPLPYKRKARGSRDQPKVLDKVLKRSVMMKARRGNSYKKKRNSYRKASIVSASGLYNTDLD